MARKESSRGWRAPIRSALFARTRKASRYRGQAPPDGPALREGELFRPADSSGAGIDHDDRSENAVMRPERNRDERFGGKGADQFPVGLFREDFVQLAIMDVADHL